MALRSSAPQYVGTAEEAREAVDCLVLDIKVSTLALQHITRANMKDLPQGMVYNYTAKLNT